MNNMVLVHPDDEEMEEAVIGEETEQDEENAEDSDDAE